MIEVEAALAVMRADGDERPDILFGHHSAKCSRRRGQKRERERRAKGEDDEGDRHGAARWARGEGRRERGQSAVYTSARQGAPAYVAKSWVVLRRLA